MPLPLTPTPLPEGEGLSVALEVKSQPLSLWERRDPPPKAVGGEGLRPILSHSLPPIMPAHPRAGGDLVRLYLPCPDSRLRGNERSIKSLHNP